MDPFRKLGIGKLFLNKISNQEEFIYWSINMETLPFYLKSGAKLYKQKEKDFWCSLCSEDIRNAVKEQQDVEQVIREQYNNTK